MMLTIRKFNFRIGIPLLWLFFIACSSTKPEFDESIPQGLVFTDSTPHQNWHYIAIPEGNDIYFLAQSPISATTVGAQLSIIRQGQLFLQDSLRRFYSQIQHDTINYPVFKELSLDEDWLIKLTSTTPFTGSLATCHYKKGKLYENHMVRRQWLAYGLVQWPGNLRNKLLEERLRLAIRDSQSATDRRNYQIALREVLAAPIKLGNN